MATYAGPMPAGPGIVTRQICFTGATAASIGAAMKALGALMGAVFGALAGLLIGLIASMITGPELLSKAAGMAFGAVIGALLGGVAGFAYLSAQITAGTCTCPAGAQGFCLNFFFQIIPGAGTVLPLPWPPTGAAGACPVLVPPGCP